jgi:hypothetical protein
VAKKEIFAQRRYDMMNEGERNARNKLNYVSTAEHKAENKNAFFIKKEENKRMMK